MKEFECSAEIKYPIFSDIIDAKDKQQAKEKFLEHCFECGISIDQTTIKIEECK